MTGKAGSPGMSRFWEPVSLCFSAPLANEQTSQQGQLDLILIKPKLEQTGRSFPPEPTDYSCEPEGGAPALTVVGWLALDVVTFLALTASTHGPRVASECSDCFSLARKATFPPLNISLKFNYAKVGCRDIRRITSCKDSQSLLDCIHTGPVLWICSLVCLFTK